MKTLLKTIENNERFLISTHVHPDGDALSSAIGVAMLVKALGKQVRIVCADPVPGRLDFLPKASWVRTYDSNKKPWTYDVAIVVDCGDLSRIGDVVQIIDQKKPLINIDHHVTNDCFGSVNYVQPDMSSTAEVLYGVIKKAKIPMTRDLAQLLYVGIMTDTGSFAFDATSSHTHKVVSELLQEDFSVADLHQKVRETATARDIQLFTDIIQGLTFELDGQVATIDLPKKLANSFTDDFDLKDNILGFLRIVRGVEVMVLLSEVDDKQTRINLRSRSKFDVAKLAAAFGGGGHKRAAGCTLDFGLENSRQKIIKAIQERM